MYFKDKVKLGVGLGVVGLIVFMLINPIYFVQSGTKAVVKRFGVVKPQVIDEGMHLRTPFIDSVITLDITPLTAEAEALCYTKDNQPIDIKYNVLFTNPVDDVADSIIKYNGKPFSNFASPKITDALKAIAGKYTASEFVTKRETIRREFIALAKEAVVNTEDHKAVINILDLPITNVDFDDQYENAIKSKQVAQQDAQKAEYRLQQARVDAQASIAKAEGEAKALTITAQAIAKNPAIVKLEEVKKWDGHYPLSAKVIGGGATIVDTK